MLFMDPAILSLSTCFLTSSFLPFGRRELDQQGQEVQSVVFSLPHILFHILHLNFPDVGISTIAYPGPEHICSCSIMTHVPVI